MGIADIFKHEARQLDLQKGLRKGKLEMLAACSTKVKKLLGSGHMMRSGSLLYMAQV